MIDSDKVTYFAETDSRNKRTPFGIKSKDRLKHVYVIGKTGMGKSTLLENMAVQDIQGGEGMAFIDPHGKTADLLLEYIPPERLKDVVYFAPFDIDHPISFNVMEDVGPEKRHLVLNGLMSAFKKLFGEESFSDRMQYILQNTILALLEYPGSTLLGVNKMLSDKTYRNKVIENITDSSVKAYWTQEYAGYTERFAAEAIPAIQNKIGQFTSNPLVRNIIGQSKSSFDFRKMMDEGKILIINLSKGRVGEANANLLGSLLITKIYLAAMSRADTNEANLSKLPNFYLYVDEFQSFANESFADILSEARKYKLNLTIAHQYIEQMSEEVRAAVFGNVGTMITFRVGAYDAEILEKEFAPTFTAEDLVNLGVYQIYLKLMIDGVSSLPFSASTLPPIKKPETSLVNEVIENSRKMFAQPKMKVEKDIEEWLSDGQGEKKSVPKPEGQRFEPSQRPERSKMGPKPIDTRGLGERPKVEIVRMEERRSIEKEESKFKKDIVAELPPDDDFKPLKTLSLEKLKEKNNNQRPPAPKNISDLRDALKSVVGERVVNKPPVQAPKAEPAPRPVPTPEPKVEPKIDKVEKEEKKVEKPEVKSKPNEIPEAELKRLLGSE